MREKIQLDQIRCERCVARLTTNLAEVDGLNDARVEMGTSSLIIDYDDEQREALDAALKKASFRIIQREVLAPDAV